jgi:hypothetical protein
MSVESMNDDGGVDHHGDSDNRGDSNLGLVLGTEVIEDGEGGDFEVEGASVEFLMKVKGTGGKLLTIRYTDSDAVDVEDCFDNIRQALISVI